MSTTVDPEALIMWRINSDMIRGGRKKKIEINNKKSSLFLDIVNNCDYSMNNSEKINSFYDYYKRKKF